MTFTSWRGVVGCIKPTLRPGGLEELIRMLPEGIGVLPLFLNISEGTTDEFKRATTPYEPLVKQLADAGCDLIHPEGAPPFMLLGFKGEADHIKKWEKQYKVPFFTSGSNHVRALRALKVKRFVGATYFRGDINKIYAKYFVDAGFDALDMAGMDVDFDKVQELSGLQVYRFVKSVFLRNSKAQAIYMLGPAWRTLDIIEKLEQDLGVPVIHAVPAQCWDIQRHLHVRQPVKGFGRLIAEMPGTGISHQSSVIRQSA